ncbi:hypothetical protein ACFX2G_035097 [Malus domestica]
MEVQSMSYGSVMTFVSFIVAFPTCEQIRLTWHHIVVELHKPKEEAKAEPRKQKHKRGLQENGLGLRELFYGVKGEDGLCESYGVAVDVVVGGDGGTGGKQDAVGGGLV